MTGLCCNNLDDDKQNPTCGLHGKMWASIRFSRIFNDDTVATMADNSTANHINLHELSVPLALCTHDVLLSDAELT